MSLLLRPYQVQAVDAADRELLARRRALLEAATGAGKTVMFAALLERWRFRGKGLVLAGREELLDQAAEKIAASTSLSCGVEQADRRVGRPLPDVTIASVPTLAKLARRQTFPRDAFAIVILDEAHHGTAASYLEVLEYFIAARLGVTATPDRADGAPLQPVFGNTVFRYPIRRAVRDGYLVDLRRAVEVLDSLDLGRVRVRAGDYDAAELEAELIKTEAVAAVAGAALRHAEARPTILFCAGITHSRVIAAALNKERPGCAAAASGEDRAGVEELRSGRVQFLCNTDLTTEGFDFPPLACVGLVRPTKSVGRATQQIGRVTRLHDGKDYGKVVEFVGASAQDQVSTVDVVGYDLPVRVRAAAEDLLDRCPEMSVLTALERCAASGGGAATSPARYRAAVDPMRLILSLDGMVMDPPRPGAAPATDAQRKILEQHGLRAVGLDIRQASMLIEGVRWRRAHQLSSPTEALELYRFGYTMDCDADVAARRISSMRAPSAARSS